VVRRWTISVFFPSFNLSNSRQRFGIKRNTIEIILSNSLFFVNQTHKSISIIFQNEKYEKKQIFKIIHLIKIPWSDFSETCVENLWTIKADAKVD
jgi:hypothetical protein